MIAACDEVFLSHRASAKAGHGCAAWWPAELCDNALLLPVKVRTSAYLRNSVEATSRTHVWSLAQSWGRYNVKAPHPAYFVCVF